MNNTTITKETFLDYISKCGKVLFTDKPTPYTSEKISMSDGWNYKLLMKADLAISYTKNKVIIFKCRYGHIGTVKGITHDELKLVIVKETLKGKVL